MINLIPPSAKKSIVREYWMRVVSVWVFIMSAVSFIFATLLIPVYVLIESKTNARTESAKVALDETTKYNLSSAELIRASKQARLLLQLQDTVRFTEFVSLLEDVQNDQVSITTYDFSLQEGAIAPINISGTALTRQALATFRQALLNHPAIEDAYLPISNLALDKNITFTVTVTMKQPS